MNDLSFAHRDFINRSPYAMFVFYSAEALGTPDPKWTGLGNRSIQDAKHETLNLTNLAIWLANPCSFSFDIIFHIDEFKTEKNIRAIRQVRDFEPHLNYVKTFLQQSDLSLAKKLHGTMLGIPRQSVIWISLYSLWNALREPEWGTRYTLLWIALEALFGPEDGREITFRLSQRIGFFLGKSRSESFEVFERAKLLYKWRSKVVHGLRLSKLKEQESISVSYDTEMLLRKSLVKILNSPKLRSKFSSSREKYLDSISFN